MQKLYKFLATGCETGMLRGAPGTYGTVVGVALYILLYRMPSFSYFLFTVTFIFFSVWITAMALPQFEKEDPSEIVIDEIAGFFVTMLFHPFSWLNLGLGFVLFRLFDITKPFPIRLIDQKVKGPWGIVLDDVLAGVFASLAIWLLRIFLK